MATVEAQIYYTKHTSIWENVASITSVALIIESVIGNTLYQLSLAISNRLSEIPCSG